MRNSTRKCDAAMAAKKMSVEAAVDEVMMLEGDDEYDESLSESDDVETESSDEQESSEDVAIVDSATACRSVTATAATPASVTPSLLSVLRPPRPSELSRKRIIDRNPPPKGTKRAKGRSGADPKSITPEKRVKESRYVNECLTVSNKKLFCRACREPISVKTSVINNHIKSAKHKSNKLKLDKREKNNKEIVDAMKVYERSENPKGSSLPEEHRLYHLKVVRTFLRAGVPLTKLNLFKDLLEEHAYRLTDRRHMSDMIPFILQQEKDQLKQEVNGKHISITFDGTSRLGEVFAVVVRFISTDHEWSIEQRLIRLQILVQTMTGDEIVRTVISTLSTEFGITSDRVLGIMHDCASANNVALRTLKVVYPSALGIGCFSHTLNRVGERFQAPCANDFTTYWVSLFSHSSKAKFLWKEKTGLTVDSYCPTRWWSKWEVMHQLVNVFGDIEQFLKSDDDFSGNTRAKLLDYFQSPTKLQSLKVELAALVDAGKPFVEATYKLESDEPIVLECFGSLNIAVKMEHYPNVQAIVKSIAKGKNDVEMKWMRHARDCIKPAMKYFDEHLKAELMNTPMKAFKAARYFSPHFLKQIKPECADLNSLLNLPFITPSQLSELREEFPKYAVLTEELSNTISSLQFWNNNALSLPKWSHAAQHVFLLQPSSAAAERVFSVLNNTFGKRQFRTLEDYIEASVMLQYNKPKDN